MHECSVGDHDGDVEGPTVVGIRLGDLDGDMDGAREGASVVGILLGLVDGATLGDIEGLVLGDVLGDFDGETVGVVLGANDGDTLGDAVMISQWWPVVLQSGTHTKPCTQPQCHTCPAPAKQIPCAVESQP